METLFGYLVVWFIGVFGVSEYICDKPSSRDLSRGEE